MTLLAYVAVLVLLLASATGGVHVSVPVSTLPGTAAGVPLPPAALEDILGAGLPSLGASRPTQGLARLLSARRILAWGIEAMTMLRLGDPLSVVGEALPALTMAPPPGSRAAPWPGLALATGGGGILRRGQLTVYGQHPLVGIYETNTRDSFWPEVRLSGRATGLPVADNPRRNMVAVASALGAALWQDGVPVALSRQVNDQEGMIGAYVHSAAVARALLATYPTVQVLLDVDRYDEPVGVSHGAARIVLVVGTNARLPDPHWRQNLQFARELGAELQAIAPGLLVGIYPSPDSLNQELLPHSLTVAIGGPDNTMAEERRAAAKLAEAIASLLASGLDGLP